MSGGSRTAIDRVRRNSAPAQERAPVAAPVAEELAKAAAPAKEKSQSVATGRTVESVSADASSEVERRETERREATMSRNVAPARQVLAQREFFPRRWPYLILGMVTTLVVALAVSGALPSPSAAMMLVLSVVLILPVSRVWDNVAGRSVSVKVLGAIAVVIVPLFLYGFGMTRWAMETGIGWDATIAAQLCVASIAMVYMRRQPGMIFAAQLAIWSAIVIANASLVGLAGVMFGFVVAVLVTREQLIQQNNEEDVLQAQARIATRAQDILTDYEETGQGWFWETDRRSQLTYVSPPVAEVLGTEPENLLGHPLTHLFNLAVTGDEGERTLMFHLSARSAFSELAVRAANKGDERWWSVSGRPLYDQFNNFIGFRGSGTDLTERKRSQENATRLARYDSLTGLANRFQMSQVLEKILAGRQENNRNCAVFLLDLDRFKQVNDTMGHPAGDALLKQVSQRLERSVGKAGQVGRLGGDEFKVVVPNSVPRQSLEELAREIIASLSQPYSIDGQRVVIGASVGIAMSPDDGTTNEELIRNADLALYAAKDGGRGRCHFYSQELHAQAEARSQMEEDLRDAMARGELELHYQPVVSTSTERICGFEALMRWIACFSRSSLS